MIDLPCARPEMVTARMVCDLLVGIRTSPRSVDFSLIILTDFFSIPPNAWWVLSKSSRAVMAALLRRCYISNNTFAVT
jgi:hypothetical protein